MRLVCPNCGAQYEVDDHAIPEGGRDVQCSACGHSWYQMPLADEQEPESEVAVAPDGAADHEREPEETTTVAEPSPEVTEEAKAEPESGPEAPADEVEPELVAMEDELPDEAGHAKKHEELMPAPVKDEVRSILQEEAEREMVARATELGAEPERVETQPDLGLGAGPDPEAERRRLARERVARLRGEEASDQPEADFDANLGHEEEVPDDEARGRELFPDIEEINSTLEQHVPSDAAEQPDGAIPVRARSGFARGFSLVVFIFAILVALYVLAPRFAETVPALKPALAAYVDAINTARGWLDTVLRGLSAQIETFTKKG